MLAGKDLANPSGAILSMGLMLETLGQREAAAAVEAAVRACVVARECTADVGGRLGTRAAADAVIARLQA